MISFWRSGLRFGSGTSRNIFTNRPSKHVNSVIYFNLVEMLLYACRDGPSQRQNKPYLFF